MKKKNLREASVRDLAVLLLLLWAFAQAMIMAFAPADSRVIYLVLILAMDVAVMIGFLGRSSLSWVLCGTLTCVWVCYKLYEYYMSGVLLALTDYVWVPVPLLGALAASLFLRGMKGMDTENTMLRRQVEELVLVDELTGLYNQRALYRDLRLMAGYAARNNLPISLMLVQMRYESELRGILPKRLYVELRQKMADTVRMTVRVEDRTYCIDEKGTLAVLLTATEKDSVFVRNRLTAALRKDGAFDGILEPGVKLDLRFACKQYSAETFKGDMMGFKRSVESELVYDV